jgi:hypothetical protein
MKPEEVIDEVLKMDKEWQESGNGDYFAYASNTAPQLARALKVAIKAYPELSSWEAAHTTIDDFRDAFIAGFAACEKHMDRSLMEYRHFILWLHTGFRGMFGNEAQSPEQHAYELIQEELVRRGFVDNYKATNLSAKAKE